MRKSLFNKVAGLMVYNFIKNKLRHRHFPVSLRGPILQNISEDVLFSVFGLRAFPKGIPSQMLFFGDCEVLQKVIPVRPVLISCNIFDVSLAVSAINRFSHG